MINRFQIINAFCELDVNKLHAMLDDNRTYQDTSKDFFLSKVGELFEVYKKAGDTKLTAFAGRCCSGECPNLGREGFSFVGNLSKYHLNIIIEGNTDEVTDMYYCSDFLPNDDLEVTRELEIDIRDDEQVIFKPSIQYLITSEKCLAAIDDLKDFSINIIAKENYLYWLAKHREMFRSFVLPPIRYRKYDDFFNLYSIINCFFNWVTYEQELETAIIAFNAMDQSDEAHLLQWLVQYEPLWEEVLSWPYDIDNNDKPDLIYVDKDHNLMIQASECASVDNFLKNFQSNYWTSLEKYRFTQDKDIIGIIMTTEEDRQNHSLTYHLKLRGLI